MLAIFREYVEFDVEDVLTKAQREGVFVPWEYVCADAAVSGTIESRKTGELAIDMGVRLVGASDGFDIANPQATLLLPISARMRSVARIRPPGCGTLNLLGIA